MLLKKLIVVLLLVLTATTVTFLNVTVLYFASAVASIPTFSHVRIWPVYGAVPSEQSFGKELWTAHGKHQWSVVCLRQEEV